jgi:HEAT repeat protein
MKDLPPEDQPDQIWIGPVGPIPIIHEDDPRFEEERAAWSAARKTAQALHSVDELLEGVRHPDWRVRHESVSRLRARWEEDPRTLETILDLAKRDEAWQVRDAAVMELLRFEPRDIEATVRAALEDANDDVRWAASYVLWQSGLTDDPPAGVD